MRNCDCSLDEVSIADAAQKSVLAVLMLINGSMFVIELACGLLADSTGLVADSLDMLADAVVYGIALYAVGRANSVKITAARWSGIFQITLACGVLLDIVRMQGEFHAQLAAIIGGCSGERELGPALGEQGRNVRLSGQGVEANDPSDDGMPLEMPSNGQGHSIMVDR